MSNGNHSVEVSGSLDVSIGTRPPAPTPPPPPPSFYMYFVGVFALLMAVACVVTTVKILFGLFELEELAFQVVFAIGTGVVTVILMSIGTRPPRKVDPPKPE